MVHSIDTKFTQCVRAIAVCVDENFVRKGPEHKGNSFIEVCYKSKKCSNTLNFVLIGKR